MIAHGTGFCQTFAPAAFAFLIQAFAFPLHVTVLFCATYHVQFHQANPRESPVYLIRYRDFSPVLLSTTVGLVDGVGVGIGVRFVGFTAGFFSGVFATVSRDLFFCAAPGIMSAIPLRIDAASLSPLTLTISSASIL